MFVSDYVLMEYGTGALMAVPAHDERDYDFAQAFGLEIRRVIDRGGEDDDLPHTGDGVLVNSGEFDGLPDRRGQARDRRVAGGARRRARVGQLPAARLAALAPALLGLPDPDRLLRRVRDPAGAGVRAAGGPARRQGLRAAGALAAGRGRGLGQHDVPVLRRRGAAARPTRWTPSSTRRGTSCATATRSTTRRRGIRRPLRWWMPVDQYIGGIEHAILHLLYARFFMKALTDMELPRRAGAVRAPVHPGHDHPRRGEDVQVARAT